MRALICCALLGCGTSMAEGKKDDGPIVVELFTSQGCSSCPPADRLLDRIAAEGAIAGRTVAPLSFHVDYWNELGWVDPYSSSAWSERQREYAHALGDGRVYTPELVVAGAQGMVGSNVERVMHAIASAPRQRAVSASATWKDAEVTIAATAPADADVWAAIWQDGTHTAVPAGENSGEMLHADRVVRRLQKIAPAGHAGTVAIALDPSWHAAGVLAFAQRTDRTIVGATVLRR